MWRVASRGRERRAAAGRRSGWPGCGAQLGGVQASVAAASRSAAVASRLRALAQYLKRKGLGAPQHVGPPESGTEFCLSYGQASSLPLSRQGIPRVCVLEQF